jgi:general secretion pathway protein N
MKRWHLWVVGTGAYILIIIATMPATLADVVLQRVSAGKLRLAEARGTLWSGAGQLEIIDAGGQAGIARNIAWHALPGSLLHGRLVCEVELASGAPRFAVMVFPTRIEVMDADIGVPATVLGIAVPKLAPFGLGGDLLIHVTHLAIGGNGAQGNATVQWRAATSTHAPVSPLGDYELRFENSGTLTAVTLRTLAGALQIDGSGSWANGASPAFSATARVEPQYREQLAPFLRMIAVERGTGDFDLQLK